RPAPRPRPAAQKAREVMPRVAAGAAGRTRIRVSVPRPEDSPAMPTLATGRGRPLPLGVTYTPDGHNFALLCRHGTRVTLVVLPEGGGDAPLAEFPLHPKQNRTGDHWHVRVGGLAATFSYGWRVGGPRGPRARFDPTRLLRDPGASMLSEGAKWAGTCEIDPQRTS